MPAQYSAGSIFLQVVPSFRGVPEQIEREARKWAKDADKAFDENFKPGEKLAKSVKDAAQQTTRESAKAGKDAADKYAGAFTEGIKRAARTVEREIGAIKLKGDDRQFQATLRQIRRDLTALTNTEAEIGLELDAGTAMIRLRELEDRLRQVQDSSASIDVKANTAVATAAVARLRQDLMQLSALQVEPEIKVDRQIGRFERTIRDSISNALQNIPPVELTADSSDVDREIAHLRQELHSLSDVEIDADFNAESALMGIASIQRRLGDLVNSRNNIDLDVNALAAISELNAIWVQVERLRNAGVKIPVDVREVMDATAQIRRLGDETTRAGRSGDDTANAFRAFQFQILAVAAAGPAAIPMIIGLTAALGAAGPLAAAGAAGLGVMALGLYGVGDAFKAMGDASANSAKEMAAHDRQVRNAAQSVSAAERAIADARADAARSSEQASRQVEDALRGVQSAERGVADARQDAAQASERAARQVQDALRGVESAERDVRDAQQAAQRAQEDLTRAREDAREKMEDLALSVRGGALAERDAILDLREAEEELADARANGITGDEMERFILDLDRARFRLDQVRESNGDLAAEQAEMARTGIEGTRGVIDARERLGDANRGVADAERALSDAHRQVAEARANETRVALEGQRRIEDAQIRLTEAHRQVADARANEARVASEGQARIAEAQLRLADAQADYNDLLGQGTASTRKLEEAMSALGPAGQAFVRYLDGLRPFFDQLRGMAQAGFLPGFQSWIDSMVGHHGPLLRDTVAGISRAVGEMFEAFGQSFRGEAFTDLFEMINRSGPTFIGQMSSILVNLGEGVASLVVAMEPLAYLFGQWLVDSTARFADWAASLRGSSGLTAFFEYVMRIGPEIAAFFSALGRAILNLVIALAPYGEVVMNILTAILDFIAGMDPATLGAIAAGLFAIVTSLQLIFGATAALAQLGSAMKLLDDVGIKLGPTFMGVATSMAWVVGAAAIAATAFFILYGSSEEFRGAVDLLWRNVLQPFASFIGDVLVGVLELLSGVLSPLATVALALGTAFLTWKVLTLVGGWLGGVITGITTLGQQAFAASQHTGGFRGALDGLGTAADGAKGKLGGLVTSMGGPWMLGIAGAMFLVGMFTQEIAKNARQAEEWARGLSEGGKAAADALAGVNAERAKYSDNWFGDLSYEIDAFFGLATSMEDVRAKQRALWQEMTPLEQAQSKVTYWTNELAHRLDDESASAADVEAAQRRLAFWTGETETEQRELESAVSGVNIRLLEQQNQIIAMADAQAAYDQSVEALAAAHERVNEALAASGAESEEYRVALQAFESQARRTAEEAGRLAESRHADADANERGLIKNAAMLISLRETEEQYGKLPPHLQTIKDGLERTVEPALLAQVEMENLGLAVLRIPDNKTIVISGDTPQEQLDRLKEIGFELTKDHEGNIVVTANTKPAEDAMNGFVNTEWKTNVTADVTWAGRRRELATGAAQRGQATSGGYAAGGPIFGPGTGTSDSILAYVSNGEYVVRADSVQKYGLDFLERINAGRFARGGLVKNGRPAFQGGGLAATWGGTINLSGGDVSPLAQIWYEAIDQIQAGAARGAAVISGLFAAMRDSVVGTVSNVRQLIPGQWNPMLQGMESSADTTRGRVLGIFDVLRNVTLGIFDQTRSGVTSTWDDQNRRVTDSGSLLQRTTAAIFDLLFRTSSQQFGDTRHAVTTTWDDQGRIVTDRTNLLQRTVQGIFDVFRRITGEQFQGTNVDVNNRWQDMSNGLQAKTTSLQHWLWATIGNIMNLTSGLIQAGVSRVDSIWRTLGGIMAGPVNTVITRVLNNGLFNAFNSVIRALGLNSAWTIPTAPEARLAAGGMVPGWSPNDKADNIPAMLTAGEFVLPVSAVDHYGPELMDLLRKKRIPKEQLAHFARGGYVGVPDYSAYATPRSFLPIHHLASAGQLFAAVRSVFPRAKLNSGYRPGDPGYHGRNMAVDLGEAGFAGGMGRPYLAAMNRWIYDTYGSAISELIYTGAGDDRADLKNGRPLNYGGATNAAHRNHVHWAMAGPLVGGAHIVGGGTFGGPVFEPPSWFNLFGSAAGVFQRILDGIGGLDSDVPGRHNSAEIMKGAVRKYPGLMWDKVKGAVEGLFGGVLNMISSAASALFGGTNASGPVVDIVKSVASKYGWSDGNEWNALSRLIQKESSWNPRAQNPTSTAYGLFQFLNSTWGGTGIGKTSDPGLQAEAGMRYIRSRYGSPSRALAFHNANNWYSEGGEVTGDPITPDLMDTGGWIHPGLNVIMNKTGRPEPVINPQTLDNLQSIAEGGGSALIGQLNLPIMPQATPVEIAGEIMHQVTVASRGGRYA